MRTLAVLAVAMLATAAGCELGSGDKTPVCDGHEVGETWDAEDGCNTCTCSESGMHCTLEVCRDCDGYAVGQSWLADDGCNTCQCTEEGVACTLMACLPDCRLSQVFSSSWYATLKSPATVFSKPVCYSS